MIPLARIVPIAVGVGVLLLALRSKKKRKPNKTKRSELPADACGLFPWMADEVDEAIVAITDTGERDAAVIEEAVARDVYPVTPEGAPQTWPPSSDDVRALCILDRIRIRVNLHLAKLADQDADDDPDDPVPPPGPSKPQTGFAPAPTPCPPGETYDPKTAQCAKPSKPPLKPFEVPVDWPDYPPPAPVDLNLWTDPGNYPTPGKFHQIGGENSGTTLKRIARKALTTAFYLIHNDLELADSLARRSDNWRAYRQLINCSPWNHVLYGAPNEPDTSGFYATPHGESLSMFPVHDRVRERLAAGEQPERRVRDDNRTMPKGGKHAFIWLPPLDEVALFDGNVVAKREHWETGDWMIMPPPEVLTHGVSVESLERTWGCDGWEVQWYEENPNDGTDRSCHPGYRFGPRRTE